uniref:Uncharacterized protein n=1 Tax=Oryza glumipatula TaxID=40148 RepID=A0A0D9ZJQ7_9ORYZ
MATPGSDLGLDNPTLTLAKHVCGHLVISHAGCRLEVAHKVGPGEMSEIGIAAHQLTHYRGQPLTHPLISSRFMQISSPPQIVPNSTHHASIHVASSASPSSRQRRGKTQNLIHIHFPTFSCSSSKLLSSPTSTALASFPIPGFVNARLFSSGFPHLKKLHLKNRHSKDLALVVDALLPAAATTITELVVERYAPSGHPTESRHRIGKDLIKIRETQVTLSLFFKL